MKDRLPKYRIDSIKNGVRQKSKSFSLLSAPQDSRPYPVSRSRDGQECFHVFPLEVQEKKSVQNKLSLLLSEGRYHLLLVNNERF